MSSNNLEIKDNAKLEKTEEFKELEEPKDLEESINLIDYTPTLQEFKIVVELLEFYYESNSINIEENDEMLLDDIKNISNTYFTKQGLLVNEEIYKGIDKWHFQHYDVYIKLTCAYSFSICYILHRAGRNYNLTPNISKDERHEIFVKLMEKYGKHYYQKYYVEGPNIMQYPYYIPEENSNEDRYDVRAYEYLTKHGYINQVCKDN